MHVHHLDVVTLREEIDADDIVEAAGAEAIELERVTAADAQHAATVTPLVRDAVDQRHGADTGSVSCFESVRRSWIER